MPRKKKEPVRAAGATDLEVEVLEAVDDPLQPERLRLPPPAIYSEDEDRTLHDEQQVARVEILMTKGVRNRSQLMQALGVTDGRKMDRYIKRVHARFELTGVNRDHARHRGEALARLDLIERQLWAAMESDDTGRPPDVRIMLVTMRQLLDVQDQRNTLLGLTPKVIERLGQEGSVATLAFSAKLGNQQMMGRLAGRMLAMIQQQKGEKAADGEAASKAG